MHLDRIVVQSQYPLKLVHDTIEQCLANVDSFLNMLTEEVLQNAKESLIGARLESRLRMREAAAKTWKEILVLTQPHSRVECLITYFLPRTLPTILTESILRLRLSKQPRWRT